MICSRLFDYQCVLTSINSLSAAHLCISCFSWHVQPRLCWNDGEQVSGDNPPHDVTRLSVSEPSVWRVQTLFPVFCVNLRWWKLFYKDSSYLVEKRRIDKCEQLPQKRLREAESSDGSRWGAEAGHGDGKSFCLPFLLSYRFVLFSAVAALETSLADSSLCFLTSVTAAFKKHNSDVQHWFTEGQ